MFLAMKRRCERESSSIGHVIENKTIVYAAAQRAQLFTTCLADSGRDAKPVNAGSRRI